MPIEQTRSNKKASGGRLKTYRKSRQYAQGSLPMNTLLGAKKVRVARKMGGERKQRLMAINVIAVTDPKSQKTTMTDILTVVDNPANTNFIRRNIITKGAIVNTKLGKVRVTSRPGQDAALAGVLVE